MTLNNIASKETWNPNSREDGRFFHIDLVMSRVRLKIFSFFFF